MMVEGTIKRKCLDDNGVPHTTMIQGNLCVPTSTICLFYAQHVDENARRKSSNKTHFKESIDSKSCVITLTKGLKEYRKTV